MRYVVLGWLWLLAMPLAAEMRIAYAASAEGSSGILSEYSLAVLRLALDEAEVAYRLQPTSDVQQGRALKLLEHKQGLDVVWTMTSAEREASLRPIRFPIGKGLIGWRVLLVRAEQQWRFSNINEDLLRQLVGGQGHDWPDTPIWQDNGFNVLPISGHDSLFEMLNRGRLQYFPRSVIEVMHDVEKYKDMSFAIEPGLLIYYPAAFYFFVHPDNEPLAQAIELGLERALANGKFDALFNRMLGPTLVALKIPERRVIVLNNLLLPAATPLSRKDLWLLPQECGRYCAGNSASAP